MKRLIPLIAAFALVLAACGGSSIGDVVTLDNGEATGELQDSIEDAADSVSDEDALLAFGACMRENGVPEFPDPVLNADGSVDFGANSQRGPLRDVDQEVAEAAVTACLDTLEGVAFAPGGVDFDINEIEDTFVEFAACMRENGVEIDDPDFSNFAPGQDGGGLNPFGDIDFDDPDTQAAVDECRDIFAGLGFGG